MQNSQNHLTEAHKTKLTTKYGIDPQQVSILSSVSAQEVEEFTGCRGISSGGIKIQYPNSPECITIRLDEPFTGTDGKARKYLKPAGQPNELFVPEGVRLDADTVIITEGEMKALAGSQKGLNVAALSGIWNWRTSNPTADHRLSDSEAMLPALNRNWNGQNIVLLYDSDIDQQHKGWFAFPGLAEQLYRLGADNVKIITLPTLKG